MNLNVLANTLKLCFPYPHEKYAYTFPVNNLKTGFYMETALFTYFEVLGSGFEKFTWKTPPQDIHYGPKASDVLRGYSALLINKDVFKLISYIKSKCSGNGADYNKHLITVNVRDGIVFDIHVSLLSKCNRSKHHIIEKYIDEYNLSNSNKAISEPQANTIPTLTLYEAYMKLQSAFVTDNLYIDNKKVDSLSYTKRVTKLCGDECLMVRVSNGEAYSFNEVSKMKNVFAIIKQIEVIEF
jgi:hypothetical protein